MAIGITSLVLWPAQALRGQTGPPASCNLYLELAKRGVPSRERSYALRALRECAASPVIARTLEAAALEDDFAARDAALLSLDRHLDRSSVPVLLELFARETPHSRHPERVVRIYRYLSRLAAPADDHVSGATATQADDRPAVQPATDSVPAWIFVQGLDHPDVRIREAALLGLGRGGLADHWPLLYTTLLAPQSARDHIAALQSARLLKGRSEIQALRAAGLTLDTLQKPAETPARLQTLSADPALLTAYAQASQHERLQAELAVLELLGDLRGPRAIERLLLYRLLSGRTSNPNSERLNAIVNSRLRGLQTTHGRPARSLQSVRLHARPTETSPVRGALATNTIVYIKDATALGYRLPPTRGVSGPEGNWLHITTLRGQTGWVHASRIQRIAIAEPPRR